MSFPEIKPKKTAQFSSNRVEVLRLLLVILSETMYVEPNPARPVRGPGHINCRVGSFRVRLLPIITLAHW